MNPIDKFLSDPSRNYDEGVALLKARLKNRNIIHILEEKKRPESYRWELLNYNLSKFSEQNIQPVSRNVIIPEMKTFKAEKITKEPEHVFVPAEQKSTDRETVRPKYVNNEFVDVSSLPKEYQKMYNRITEIYELTGNTHEAIKKAKTDKERQPLVQQLVELEDEQLQLWKKLDEYSVKMGNEKTNKAPSQTEKYDMVKAVKRLKVVKDNISRGKKDLKGLEKGSSAYQRKQKTIDKFTEVLADLNAAIEAHK